MKSYAVLASLGALVLVTLGAGLAEAIIALHSSNAQNIIDVQVGILRCHGKR